MLNPLIKEHIDKINKDISSLSASITFAKEQGISVSISRLLLNRLDRLTEHRNRLQDALNEVNEIEEKQFIERVIK